MKEGWKYVKLGDIATEMYRGSGIKRDQVVPEGFPCVRYGEIYTTYNITFDNCVSHTIEADIQSPKYIEYGDLIFAITGESVEEIGKTVAYLGNERCLLGGDIVAMKHKQNAKYLSYALSTPNAIKQKGLGKTKLKVVHTNIPSLKEIQIPLPPLSEQQRIVEQLDSAFAKIDALKANAEKLVEEAKALFAASLREAMKPKEGWEEKKLTDEFKLKSGEYLSSKMMIEGDIPVYGGNGIAGYHNQSNLEGKQILIGRVGALCGNIHMTDGRIWVSDNAFIVNGIKEDWNLDFLFHELTYMNLNQYASQTAQPVISNKSMKDVVLYLPPLSEQTRIVSTLDTLSAQVRQLEDNFKKVSEECDALKQAILRETFE